MICHLPRYCLYGVLTLMYASAAIGQNLTLAIGDDSLGRYDIGAYVELLEDPSGELTFSEIVFSDDFQLLEAFDNFFEKESVYWGKIHVINLDSTQLTWLMNFPRNDFVEIYEFKEHQGILRQITGYLVPESRKSIVEGSNFAPVSLPYGVEKSIFFRVSQEIHNHNFRFLTLQNPFHMFRKYSDRTIFNMVFQGFLWIMILYNILTFIHFRDRAGVSYSLYLLSIAIFYLFSEGNIREGLLSEFPFYSIYFLTFIFLAPFFYYFFMKEFLEIHLTVPGWNKVLRFLAFGSLTLFFLSNLVILLDHNFLLVMKVARFTILSVTVLALMSLVSILRSKHEMVNYFVWGTMLLVIGGIVDAIIWDQGETWGNYARVGLVAEILLFSLGLGKRMKLIELAKREAQQSLIDELKRNEILVADQKKELEKEVEIRTEELRARNDQLEKAKAGAEAAAKTKSEFLSVMSHEIRTPMNAIIGMTHLLLEDNPRKEQVENLRSLKFSANSLVQLINDILDLNKIESGKIELETAEFDLRDLVKQINYLFKPRADEKSIAFVISIAPDVDRYFLGDQGRLSQILNNLISNAIKFTEVGSVEMLVRKVSETEEFTELAFEVKDTGVGIPGDKLTTIFENFAQAASNTTRKYGGTGLGLAISKKLLEIQDSSIQVFSKVGSGSVFSFILRLGRIKDQDTVRTEGTFSFEAMEGFKVLVVDDNVLNRVVLEQFLDKWKVAYSSVEGGVQALNEIGKTSFNLILLDIQMPDMDGYEVAQEIRKMQEPKKSIPIIALSADVYGNVYDRIIKAGMDDFVSKPFKPEELYKILKRYFRLETIKDS